MPNVMPNDSSTNAPQDLAACPPRLRYFRGKAFIELPLDDLPASLHDQIGRPHLRREGNCVLAEQDWLKNTAPELLPFRSVSTVCGTLVCSDHHLVKITQRGPGYFRLENPYGSKWVQLTPIKGGEGWISPKSLAIRSELPFAFSLRSSVKIGNLGKGGSDQAAIFSSSETRVLVALHITDEDYLEMAWCPSISMAQAIVSSYRCVGGRPSVAIDLTDLDGPLRQMVRMGLFPSDGQQAWIDLEFLREHWPEELGVDRHPILGVRTELVRVKSSIETDLPEILADDRLRLGDALRPMRRRDTRPSEAEMITEVASPGPDNSAEDVEPSIRGVLQRAWSKLHDRVMRLLEEED